MKYLKRILTVVVFFAGLLGILMLSTHVFLPKNNTKEQMMEDYVANGVLGEKPGTIDALIVGDSEAHRSIIPLQIWQETGYTVYNSGSAKQPLSYTNIMLERVFENQSPKIVILETNTIFRKNSVNMTVYNEATRYLPIFRYHDRWKILTLADFTQPVEHTWTHEDKGYRHKTNVTPVVPNGYMSPSKSVEKIPEINQYYMQVIKKFCDDHNAKLVLLSTPSTKNWNTAKHNGIEKLSEELCVEFIDMNLMTEEVPIDWEKDTPDKGDHLNYYGAVKVTSCLTEYLKETGLLESHAGDPEYAGWDKEAKRFEDSLKNK